MKDITSFRLPSAHGNTIILFFLILLTFILFIILVGFIRSYLTKRQIKASFFKEALERGLTEKEAQILWTYSLKLGRDPFLALEFKAPFEKVVDLYLREDPNAKEELIRDMRSKLGFDYVPYFVPLVTTKDIELFQPGKLILPDNTRYDVALFDKDERYMYWAVIDSIPHYSFEGQKVTITFIRKGDGIYTIESVVEGSFMDNGKLVLKMPHTFELNRYQRREHPRVEVELPAKIGIPKEIKEGDKVRIEYEWVDGEIADISAGGAKVCVKRGVLEKELPPSEGIILKFNLAGSDYNLRSTVVNIYPGERKICYGVKFEKIKPEEQKAIYEFVKNEQKRLAQLAIRSRG
jgi:c-di-GMP-binding flagellar brake protein YcgR